MEDWRLEMEDWRLEMVDCRLKLGGLVFFSLVK